MPKCDFNKENLRYQKQFLKYSIPKGEPRLGHFESLGYFGVCLVFIMKRKGPLFIMNPCPKWKQIRTKLLHAVCFENVRIAENIFVHD